MGATDQDCLKRQGHGLGASTKFKVQNLPFDIDKGAKNALKYRGEVQYDRVERVKNRKENDTATSG